MDLHPSGQPPLHALAGTREVPPEAMNETGIDQGAGQRSSEGFFEVLARAGASIAPFMPVGRSVQL